MTNTPRFSTAVSIRTFYRVLYWCIPIITFGVFTWYFTTTPHELRRLFQLDPLIIAALSGLNISIFVTLGLQFTKLTSLHGTRISVFESIWLSIANNILNYVPAKAGLLARGAYIHAVHKMPIKSYVTATITSQILQSLLAAILGILAVIWIQVDTTSTTTWPIFLVLSVFSVLFLCLLILPKTLYTSLSKMRIASIAGWYIQGIHVWWDNRITSCLFIGLTLIALLLTSLRLWFALYGAGSELTIADALLIQSCATISFVFSFSPGNLGVREGLITGLAVALGSAIEPAVLTAIIDRISVILFTGILGPYAFHRLTRTSELSRRN